MRVPHLPPSTVRRRRWSTNGRARPGAPTEHQPITAALPSFPVVGSRVGQGIPLLQNTASLPPGCGHLFHRRRVCDDGASCVSNADVCGGLWRSAGGSQHSGAVNRLPPILRHPSRLRCVFTLRCVDGGEHVEWVDRYRLVHLMSRRFPFANCR